MSEISESIQSKCLDLRAAFPESKGFSRANLYRMGRFYGFYAGQKEIVAQVVRQLQPAESKGDTIVAQVVRQLTQTPAIAADGDSVMTFPAFLGMVPWGHHVEIFESCKDVLRPSSRLSCIVVSNKYVCQANCKAALPSSM